MQIRLALGSLAAAVSFKLTGVAQAEPLRIFYFTWVGYGPLFLAQEKGFFGQEGVEVELIKLDDHTAAFSGLFAGQVDAIAAGTQDVLTFAEPDEDLLVCVLPLDKSRGGDGILAIKEIQSIADLKGRSVAVSPRQPAAVLSGHPAETGWSQRSRCRGRGSFRRHFRRGLHDEGGRCGGDLRTLAHHGQKAEHGHLLTDTSKQPGLISDCLETTAGVLDHRRQEFQAVGRAWIAAVEYFKTHPDEAVAIMTQVGRRFARRADGVRRGPQGRRDLRCGGNSRSTRHAGAVRPDLPDDGRRDRRLVGARRAEGEGHAGRRDRARECRRVARARRRTMV